MENQRLMVDAVEEYRRIQHRFVFDESAADYIEWVLEDVDYKDFFSSVPRWSIPPFDPMFIQINMYHKNTSMNELGFVINRDFIQPLYARNETIYQPAVRWLYGDPHNLQFKDNVYEMIETNPEMVESALAFISTGVLAIAILNQPSMHKTNRVDHKRAIVKGKSVVYKAYNNVTIDLKRDDKLYREFFNTGTRGTYRRHEVRGQWYNWNKPNYGCTHAFVEREVKNPDPDRPRYICEHCGQFRTWKPSFERGDASKGWASKQYQVTHSGG